MNKISIKIVLIVFCFHNIFSSGVFDSFKKTTAGSSIAVATEQLFVDIVQEKRGLLEKLQQEQVIDKKNYYSRKLFLQEALDELNNEVKTLEREHHKFHDQGFIHKKLTLKVELQQIIKDLVQIMDDLLALKETFIQELLLFVNDPQSNRFKAERHIEASRHYSFEDLQSFYEMVIVQERFVAQLAEQEKNAHIDQESRKRLLSNLEEDYYKKQKEREEGQADTAQQRDYSHSQKDIFVLEEGLLKYKKELYELKVIENKITIDLLLFRIFYEKTNLDILKQHIKSIKSAIYVTEPDIVVAKNKLNREKQHYFLKKQEFQLERDRINGEQKRQERLRDEYAKGHNIVLGSDLDKWDRKPKNTIQSFISIARLGTLNAELQWLSKQRDLIDAQRALEDEKLTNVTVQTSAKDSYFKILNHKFFSSDEISKEMKQYESQKAEALATLNIYKERMNTVADLLNQQKKIQDNIVGFKEALIKQRDVLFKHNLNDFTGILDDLNMAQEYIKRKITILGKLTGAYSGIISVVNETVRLLAFINNELQSTSIWYRPGYAITWLGIQNITTDLKLFFTDIKAYVIRLNIDSIGNKLLQLFTTWSGFLMWLKVLLLCLLLYVTYLGSVWLIVISQEQLKDAIGLRAIVYCMSFALAAFYHKYKYLIFLFSLPLFLFFIEPFEQHFQSIIYLLLIPLALFLINKFMRFLIECNVRYDYKLLAVDFQYRFVWVISALLYATTAIFLFRQSFIKVSYYQTELPIILLALNFIVFQISLILLITKDQILGIFPDSNNEVMLWIKEQFDHYFYLMLCFFIMIIVMSNPYVGFGRLVLYLLSSLALTFLLTKALLVLHGGVKNIARHAFFTADDEMMRERFDHARTWFGLLIIMSFFFFTFLGLVVGATIWGWHVTFKDVLALLYKPLFLESTVYPVTFLSLLQIIGFIMFGFFAAYAINKFVLDRIFDLLLVDPGVQYTTTRFIQYSVVIIFVFFGFKNVGLGDLVGYALGALALGVGWYVREPIGDLMAYFIILVQRPLKIGDFIQMDSEIFGVVRKITPRAVVLRRRNSTTIVVPNSHIINRAIVNWNYVRTFIAFNDITLIVGFKEDPTLVKELLFKAVNQHPNVLRNPKALVRLEEFGEFGYVFLVRGFISSAYTLEMWDIASDVRIIIAKLLQEHGIEVVEVMRIMKEGVNKISKISPQQKEMTDKKIIE